MEEPLVPQANRAPIEAKQLAIVVAVAVIAGCTDVMVGGSLPKTDIEGPGREVDGDVNADKASDFDSNTDIDMTTDVNMDTEIDTDTATRSDDDTGAPVDTNTDTDSDSLSGADSEIDDNIEECAAVDEYDLLGEVCYIDSVAGDDLNSGLFPDEPFKTQSAIGPGCVVARFKRGSQFGEKLALRSNTKVYTNYGDESEPLPKFVVPAEPMSGPVVQTPFRDDGITIDGLYIAGARGDGTMENVIGGICVFLGSSDSKVLNSEITSCDIGAMIAGQGALFQGNYVHDLKVGVEVVPDADPNTVGGAVGVFITASSAEVAYNTFVNCQGPAEWAPNSTCDGGATEVTVAACETIADVEIHHNFSFENCGFLEIATTSGDCKGELRDSKIYHNVSIDSAWMGFLQVNNTSFNNIHFYNNTNIHHQGSLNAGSLWVIYTGTSSGMTGGDLLPGTVFLTNNLFVFDEVSVLDNLIDADFEQTTNLIIHTDHQDPGVVDIDGRTPSDFDLTASSPARDSGTIITGNTLDFMNRTIPDPSGAADVGAYEFGSSQGDCLPSRSPILRKK